jgi:hypothetical protein
MRADHGRRSAAVTLRLLVALTLVGAASLGRLLPGAVHMRQLSPASAFDTHRGVTDW